MKTKTFSTLECLQRTEMGRQYPEVITVVQEDSQKILNALGIGEPLISSTTTAIYNDRSNIPCYVFPCPDLQMKAFQNDLPEIIQAWGKSLKEFSANPFKQQSYLVFLWVTFNSYHLWVDADLQTQFGFLGSLPKWCYHSNTLNVVRWESVKVNLSEDMVLSHGTEEVAQWFDLYFKSSLKKELLKNTETFLLEPLRAYFDKPVKGDYETLRFLETKWGKAIKSFLMNSFKKCSLPLEFNMSAQGSHAKISYPVYYYTKFDGKTLTGEKKLKDAIKVYEQKKIKIEPKYAMDYYRDFIGQLKTEYPLNLLGVFSQFLQVEGDPNSLSKYKIMNLINDKATFWSCKDPEYFKEKLEAYLRKQYDNINLSDYIILTCVLQLGAAKPTLYTSKSKGIKELRYKKNTKQCTGASIFVNYCEGLLATQFFSEKEANFFEDQALPSLRRTLITTVELLYPESYELTTQQALCALATNYTPEYPSTLGGMLAIHCPESLLVGDRSWYGGFQDFNKTKPTHQTSITRERAECLKNIKAILNPNNNEFIKDPILVDYINFFRKQIQQQ